MPATLTQSLSPSYSTCLRADSCRLFRGCAGSIWRVYGGVYAPEEPCWATNAISETSVKELSLWPSIVRTRPLTCRDWPARPPPHPRSLARRRRHALGRVQELFLTSGAAVAICMARLWPKELRARSRSTAARQWRPSPSAPRAALPRAAQWSAAPDVVRERFFAYVSHSENRCIHVICK